MPLSEGSGRCSLELEVGKIHGGTRVINTVMAAVLDLALQELVRQDPQLCFEWRALPCTALIR
jgi:hypothetical protein